jgi:hypothetical protein
MRQHLILFNSVPNYQTLEDWAFFSCDPCDCWRQKDIAGRRVTKPRSEIKSFFLFPDEKRYGSIFYGNIMNCSLLEDEENTNAIPVQKRARHSCSLKSIPFPVLDAVASSVLENKQKVGIAVEERLKLIKELQGEIKTKGQKFAIFKRKFFHLPYQ